MSKKGIDWRLIYWPKNSNKRKTEKICIIKETEKDLLNFRFFPKTSLAIKKAKKTKEIYSHQKIEVIWSKITNLKKSTLLLKNSKLGNQKKVCKFQKKRPKANLPKKQRVKSPKEERLSWKSGMMKKIRRQILVKTKLMIKKTLINKYQLNVKKITILRMKIKELPQKLSKLLKIKKFKLLIKMIPQMLKKNKCKELKWTIKIKNSQLKKQPNL